MRMRTISTRSTLALSLATVLIGGLAVTATAGGTGLAAASPTPVAKLCKNLKTKAVYQRGTCKATEQAITLSGLVGPAGPAGPAGPIGLTGPAGPAGPAGAPADPTGTVITHKKITLDTNFPAVGSGVVNLAKVAATTGHNGTPEHCSTSLASTTGDTGCYLVIMTGAPRYQAGFAELNMSNSGENTWAPDAEVSVSWPLAPSAGSSERKFIVKTSVGGVITPNPFTGAKTFNLDMVNMSVTG
jgi:hypothetical protein